MADTARLQNDLRTLVGDQYQAPSLRPRGAATPIPAGIGSAPLRLPGAGTAPDAAEQAAQDADPSNQPGIASPLTEPSYAAREWYDSATITSTDGAISIRVKRLKKIAMTDAVGRPVVMNFANAA